MVANLGERLFRMHNENIMTDITFVVEGTEIKSHKNVVSSHGGPLQELVQGNLEKVEIEEVSLTTFKTLLQYLYTDGCTVDNANVFELFYAAKLFQLNDLEFRCTSLIKSKISEANILSYTQQALDFHARELLNDCLDYFGNNATKLMQQKDILEVTQEVLIALCGSQKIECSELDLFLKSVEWAKFQCEQSGKESSPGNVRETLGEVLNKIRFTCVGIDDFRKIIVPMKILTFEEIGKVIATEDQEERRQYHASSNGNVRGSGSAETTAGTSRRKELPDMSLADKQESDSAVANAGPVDIVRLSRMKLLDGLAKDFETRENPCSVLETFSAYIFWIKCWFKEDKFQVEHTEYYRELLGMNINKVKFNDMPLHDFLDFVVPMNVLTNERIGRVIFEMLQKKWNKLPYGIWIDTVEVLVLDYHRERKSHSRLDIPWSTRISALKEMNIFEGGTKSYPAKTFTLTHDGQKLTDDSTLLMIAEKDPSILTKYKKLTLSFEVHSIVITVKEEKGKWEHPMEIKTDDLWERCSDVIIGFVFGLEGKDEVKTVRFKPKFPGATAVVVMY